MTGATANVVFSGRAGLPMDLRHTRAEHLDHLVSFGARLVAIEPRLTNLPSDAALSGRRPIESQETRRPLPAVRLDAKLDTVALQRSRLLGNLTTACSLVRWTLQK